ncbi:MAG: cob(I)alamin adenosyltransferase [bacterium]|jgi:cob(I)alamin adenosyltransferase
MVRITKVYTKTGDGGETSLVGGHRIPKDHVRIESYGAVDELNSILGIVRSFNDQKEDSLRKEKFDIILQNIQQTLFDIGSQLATHPDDLEKLKIQTKEEDIQWLENVIDAMNEEVPPLNSFILPGGSPLNSFLHQARTVCRRTERAVIRLEREESVAANLIPYLNRLSDALFVFGRWVSATMNEKEILWMPNQQNTDWHWK